MVEKLPDADAVLDADGRPDAHAVRLAYDADAVCDGLAVPVEANEAELETVMVGTLEGSTVTRDELEPVALRVKRDWLANALRDTEELREADALKLEELDWLRVTAEEGVAGDLLADGDGVELRVTSDDAVEDTLGKLADAVDEPGNDTDKAALREAEGVRSGDAVAAPDPEREPDGLRELLELTEELRVTDGDPLGVAVADRDADTDGDREADGDADDSSDDVGAALDEAVAVPSDVSLAALDPEREPDGLREPLGLTEELRVADGDLLSVADAVVVADTDGERDADGDDDNSGDDVGAAPDVAEAVRSDDAVTAPDREGVLDE